MIGQTLARPENEAVSPNVPTHDDYTYRHPDWLMIRDFVEGERRVKGKGTTYLPRLDGQTDANYDAYLRRTKFFPAVDKTLNALLGLLFRQAPVNRLSPELQNADWHKNVDRRGTHLSVFQKQCAKEVLSLGRAGVLIDAMPDADIPHLVRYQAEHIADWATDRGQLVYVVIWENTNQYRELYLEGGEYRQTVYSRDEEDADFLLSATTTPLRAGQPLDYIPFYPLGWRDNDIEVDKPPLLDLTWLNWHHYMMSAAYANGSWLTGVPQPYMTGYAPEVGPDGKPQKLFTALSLEDMPCFSDTEARMRYLEHNGTGLGHLEKLLEDTKGEMSTIGVRMLAQERLPQETATSARIHRMSEISVLTGTSRNLSDAFTRILETVRDWAQDTGDVETRLGTEFFPVHADADQLLKYAELYKAGAITKEELHDIMIAADVRSAEKTIAEVEAEVMPQPEQELGLDDQTEEPLGRE